jgi:hypothetical protein
MSPFRAITNFPDLQGGQPAIRSSPCRRNGLVCSPGGAAHGWRFLHLAGERELDLGLALDILNQEPRTKRLPLERRQCERVLSSRGPHRRDQPCNIPGRGWHQGAPYVFDSCDEEAGAAAPVRDDARKWRGAGGRRGLARPSGPEQSRRQLKETATWRISNGGGSGGPRST